MLCYVCYVSLVVMALLVFLFLVFLLYTCSSVTRHNVNLLGCKKITIKNLQNRGSFLNNWYNNGVQYLLLFIAVKVTVWLHSECT